MNHDFISATYSDPRSSPLVPLDSCLTAFAHVSLVHVSACSFAVSQASDLALL